MASKLAHNLSANALQLILNQLTGLIIFYILSTSLNKTDFGRLNLALAVLLAVFNILSLGIDQLIIKKIASGGHLQQTLSLYIGHVLIAGVTFYGAALAGKLFFAYPGGIYNLILLVGIGKLLIFFSTPFKQAANGLEKFKLMAYMLVVSNLVRCIALLVFALLHTISLQLIVIAFITGDCIELLLCVYLFKRNIKTTLPLKWNKPGYINLIKEALPQAGVVVITSALTRFDWIFIGFTLSAIKLAEYSFAYKVFEIATLPMLSIAPLLIPRFTKFFMQENADISGLKFLIRIEIVIAVFIALLINMCWAPVIDYLTAGKYGVINVKTIFILSLCMPLLYINNFLWTIYFAKGQLKLILHSFIIALLINVLGDVILIPLYKNEGAAFAFLLSCLAQTLFYLKKNDVAQFNTIWQSLVICTGCALFSGFFAQAFLSNNGWATPLAALFYLVLLIATVQLKFTDRKNLQLLFN